MTLLPPLDVRRSRNQVSCLKFTSTAFKELVREASNGQVGQPSNTQTDYLAAYLDKHLDASSLVVESHYIDRHFIEEVGLYYSRCLSHPPNWCTRIHVFSEEVDDAELNRLLVEAASGKREETAELLNDNYRGYVVVRPLPSVPIGRTVLAPPDGDANRRFPTLVGYDSHLAGFKLRNKGLSFQQQDQAVGACATTAVWTALQRICRHDGGRAPTPSAITETAVRHFLPEGRPFPSSGLTIEQICEALRGFGFPPAFFRVGSAPQMFLALIQVYVWSGIPVILALRDSPRGGGGHAVTVAGFRQAAAPRSKMTVRGESLTLRNLEFDQIYIHDDRLGPYASATLSIGSAHGTDDLRISIEFPDGTVDEKSVTHGLAPLYPKLRTTADEVLSASVVLMPTMGHLLGWSGPERALEIQFDRSGSYAASLFDTDVDPHRLARFQRAIAMSRYVGIARWSVGSQDLVDVVWDTTDTLRVGTYDRQLIGMVARDPRLAPLVDAVAKQVGAETA